jgi:hypothetical protein
VAIVRKYAHETDSDRYSGADPGWASGLSSVERVSKFPGFFPLEKVLAFSSFRPLSKVLPVSLLIHTIIDGKYYVAS